MAQQLDCSPDSRPIPPVIDRRCEERIPLPVDVELRGPRGDAQAACLRDFSRRGIGLEHHRPLQVGDVVTCRLLDAPVDLPCEYRLEILWQDRRADGTVLSGGRILSEDE